MVRATYIIVLLYLSGCANPVFVGYDGPCPLRPELQPITVEVQEGTEDAILSLINDNTPPEIEAQIRQVAELEVAEQKELLLVSATNLVAAKQHIIDLEDLSGCEK